MKKYVYPRNYHNVKLKIYPDGNFKKLASNKSIFHYPEDEILLSDNNKEEIISAEETMANKAINNAIKIKEKLNNVNNDKIIREDTYARIKEKIFDIINCNDWSYFITVTIDPKIIDSSDVKTVMKKLSNWLHNKSKRRGLKYILIPERHKSGAIHLHGLINDVLHMDESGTVLIPNYEKPVKIKTAKKLNVSTSECKIVYNIKDWNYGFTTAIGLYGDLSALSVYLCKYITKNTTRIFGKYYWSSQDIKREPNIILYDEYYYNTEGYEKEIKKLGIKLKYESSYEYKKGNEEKDVGVGKCNT